MQTQLIVPELSRDQDQDNLSFPAVSLPSASSTKSQPPLKALPNPSQALAHLTKHKSQLASLPEKRRRAAEEREKWAKAEERAGGGKVADQEGVLRKAVKRAEKGKAKSGKEWLVSLQFFPGREALLPHRITPRFAEVETDAWCLRCS